MSIKFPRNRKEISDRMKSEVKSALPGSDPYLKNSFLGALLTSLAGRVYESYLQLKNALLEMFPDTASGIFLDRWGSYVGINRLPPSVSRGAAVFTGTHGSLVPAGTVVSSSEGVTYQTLTDGYIANTVITLSSLTRAGSTATAVTTGVHNFASGMEVVIAGATPSGYNGTQTITVVDATTFSFSVDSSLSASPTGTISATATFVALDMRSVETGSVTNINAGTELTLNVVLTGVDSTVFTSLDGFTGGEDLEKDYAYRDRVLYRYQNPVALFNTAAITNKVFEVPGVSRVWVHQAGTNGVLSPISGITRSGNFATLTYPGRHFIEDGQYIQVSGADQAAYNRRTKCLSLSDTTVGYFVDGSPTTPATSAGGLYCQAQIPGGQVKIYSAFDARADPIPTYTDLATITEKVLSIKPAHVADGDVFVLAPVRKTVDFVFTSLTPNSTAAQDAITTALQALFSQDTSVGVSIQDSAYIAAIWQATDSVGTTIRDFTLSSPSGDVTVADGELPVLGTITFP